VGTWGDAAAAKKNGPNGNGMAEWRRDPRIGIAGWPR
jgi:hypothetical protein